MSVWTSTVMMKPPKVDCDSASANTRLVSASASAPPYSARTSGRAGRPSPMLAQHRRAARSPASSQARACGSTSRAMKRATCSRSSSCSGGEVDVFHGSAQVGAESVCSSGTGGRDAAASSDSSVAPSHAAGSPRTIAPGLFDRLPLRRVVRRVPASYRRGVRRGRRVPSAAAAGRRRAPGSTSRTTPEVLGDARDRDLPDAADRRPRRRGSTSTAASRRMPRTLERAASAARAPASWRAIEDVRRVDAARASCARAFAYGSATRLARIAPRHIRNTPNFGSPDRRVQARRDRRAPARGACRPGRSRRRPRAARSRSTGCAWCSNWSRIGCLNAASSSALHWPPLASMPSRLTVASTLAACSPPITLMRAFGHIHRKRGEYARPHMP